MCQSLPLNNGLLAPQLAPTTPVKPTTANTAGPHILLRKGGFRVPSFVRTSIGFVDNFGPVAIFFPFQNAKCQNDVTKIKYTSVVSP